MFSLDSNCGCCPHGSYLYKVSRVNGKQVWQYLGRDNKKGADEKNDSDQEDSTKLAVSFMKRNWRYWLLP
jgi:hypothetical protein